MRTGSHRAEFRNSAVTDGQFINRNQGIIYLNTFGEITRRCGDVVDQRKLCCRTRAISVAVDPLPEVPAA